MLRILRNFIRKIKFKIRLRRLIRKQKKGFWYYVLDSISKTTICLDKKAFRIYRRRFIRRTFYIFILLYCFLSIFFLDLPRHNELIFIYDFHRWW